MAAGCRVPVIFGVIVPSSRIESMHVVELADCCSLGVAASRTSVGLYALGGLGGLSCDNALVPYVRAKIFFLVVMAAGCRMPVIGLIFFPNIFVEGVLMFEFINGLGFLISAHRAGVGSDALGCFGGRGGDNACIKSMIGFVCHIRVLFGHTFMPVSYIVMLPLA